MSSTRSASPPRRVIVTTAPHALGAQNERHFSSNLIASDVNTCSCMTNMLKPWKPFHSISFHVRTMQAAFGAALQQALDLGVDRIERRLGHLASLVRKGLAAVPGVTVRDHGRRLCAICSFTKVCQGSQRVCFPSAKMQLQCLGRRGKLRPACSYCLHAGAMVQSTAKCIGWNLDCSVMSCVPQAEA